MRRVSDHIYVCKYCISFLVLVSLDILGYINISLYKFAPPVSVLNSTRVAIVSGFLIKTYLNILENVSRSV